MHLLFAVSALLATLSLIAPNVQGFCPRTTHTLASATRTTSHLYYRNDHSGSPTTTGATTTATHFGQNSTVTTSSMLSRSRRTSLLSPSRRRELLKRQLAAVAIENYDNPTTTEDWMNDDNSCTTAEDIMRQLEEYCPVARPVHVPELLNARWSFVFTGVPTIGMKLITLLSRLSTTIRPIDFENVYLDVYDQQTKVKAVVRFCLLGMPMELNVYTALQPNNDDDNNNSGTHLWETFQSIVINGITIPTPKAWQKSRDLEIRYLDDDFMIARTAGGEPHLLLRHSPCGTDNNANDQQEEECDIEADLTEYFQAAQAKYGGQGLARSLVDRTYQAGDESTQDLHSKLHVAATIPQLLHSIFTGQH